MGTNRLMSCKAVLAGVMIGTSKVSVRATPIVGQSRLQQSDPPAGPRATAEKSCVLALVFQRLGNQLGAVSRKASNLEAEAIWRVKRNWEPDSLDYMVLGPPGLQENSLSA